jgi:radical SAM protein with 4Fe4S-binding SPASM domain
MDKVWKLARNNDKVICNVKDSSVSALIKLTSSCRSQCKYCLSWKTSKEFLPFSSVRKVITDLGNFGAQRITFSGGEPTTHPDFAGIVNDAKKANSYINVITDGQFLNNQDWFSSVDELTFSIDTIDSNDYKLIRGIDGLDIALKNLEKAIIQGVKVSVNIVLSKQAIHKLDATVNKFANFGVSNIYFLELETHLNINKDIIPSSDDINILKGKYIPFLKNSHPSIVHIDKSNAYTPNDKEKSNPCLIPWMHLTIRSNGEVYPCCRIGDDNPEGNDISYCLGNIIESSISDIWLSLNRTEILNSIKNSPPYPCLICSIGSAFTNTEVWKNIESIRM